MNNTAGYEDSPPSYPGSAAGGRGYVPTLYIARDYACILYNILVVGVIMGLTSRLFQPIAWSPVENVPTVPAYSLVSGRECPNCSSL